MSVNGGRLSLSSTFSLHNSHFHSSRNSSSAGNASVMFNFGKHPLVCFSSKNKPSFVEQILDYIEGGPKLRKWYGASDRLPKDGSVLEEDDKYPEKDEVRDAVLVTDGDNDIGQDFEKLFRIIYGPEYRRSKMMILLSLIVKRTRVKALVKDKQAAVEAFGTYLEPIAGDTNDRSFQKKALRGVRAIICPNEGFFTQVESLEGVEHVIILSQALMNSKARKLAEQDEAMVMASGIPYTIIRAGSLQDTPGGKQGFSFKEGSAEGGHISKEDAAIICTEALDAVPQRGLIFEVINGDEKVSDWKECFAMLMEKAEQQLQ